MFRIDKNFVNLAQGARLIQQEIDNASGKKSVFSNPDDAAAAAAASAKLIAHDAVARAIAESENIVDKARDDATEILVKAREDAMKLTKEANAQKEEAEELLQTAKETVEEDRRVARQEATEEGMRKYDAKLQEDDEMLRRVINELYEERSRMVDEFEGELVELSMEIARKVINSDISGDTFRSMIMNVLSHMNLHGKLTIRVGAAEYDRFFSTGHAVFALGDGATVTAAVIRDSLLQDGDCIVDTEDETINAGVDSQLKLIELSFNKARQQ